MCEGTYPHFTASRVHPGKYVSVNADEVTAQPNKGVVKDEDLGVEPIRVTLTQHDPRVGPGAPADVTTPQKGPAFSPDRDVFGNWFITAASFGGWGPKDVTQSLRWDQPEPPVPVRVMRAVSFVARSTNLVRQEVAWTAKATGNR